MPNRVWLGLPRPLAAGSQPPVEEPDALVVVLRADRPRAGNGGPAAVRDDLLVALDGALERLDHLLAAQRHPVGPQVVERFWAAAVLVGRGPRFLGALEAGKFLPPLVPARMPARRAPPAVSAAERQKTRRDASTKSDLSRPALASDTMPAFSFNASRLRCHSPPCRLHRGRGPNRRRQRHPCGASPPAASIPTMHRYGQTKTVH